MPVEASKERTEQLSFRLASENPEELRCPGNHARVDVIGHLSTCHRVLPCGTANPTLVLFSRHHGAVKPEGVAFSGS